METFFYNNASLPVGAESYIVRKTDFELKENIKAKKFCCVYSSRMMGKTSLMKKTNADLSREGYLCAEIDASAFIDTIEENWYYSIFHKILSELKIDFDLEHWWTENLNLVSSIKFIEFIKVLLSKTDQEIVIFIDEVDTYIKSIVEDKKSVFNNFLSALLYFHYERENNSRFSQINFCLFGLHEIYSLLVNHGKTIAPTIVSLPLSSFSEDELATVLSFGGHQSERLRKSIIKRIFYWTSGHPYLTQTICQEIMRLKNIGKDLLKYETPIAQDTIALIANVFSANEAGMSDAVLESSVSKILHTIVHSLFLERISGSLDNNLWYIEESILKHPDSIEIVDVFDQVRKKKGVAYDPNEPLGILLFFTGVLGVEAGHYVVSNRIYAEFFNQGWFEELYAKRNPLTEDINRWKHNGEGSQFLLDREKLRAAIAWKNANDYEYSKYEEKYIEDSRKKINVRRYNRIMVLSAILLVFFSGVFLVYSLISNKYKSRVLLAEISRLETENKIYKQKIAQLETRAMVYQANEKALNDSIRLLTAKLEQAIYEKVSKEKEFEKLSDENARLLQESKVKGTNSKPSYMPATDIQTDFLLKYLIKRIYIVTPKTRDGLNEEYFEGLKNQFKKVATADVRFQILDSELMDIKEDQLRTGSNKEYDALGADLVVFASMDKNKNKYFKVYTSRKSNYTGNFSHSSMDKDINSIALELAKGLHLNK